ncbi:helicase [Gracilaria domingensis]|nr:helicase [Gracilaria domingensis]
MRRRRRRRRRRPSRWRCPSRTSGAQDARRRHRAHEAHGQLWRRRAVVRRRPLRVPHLHVRAGRRDGLCVRAQERPRRRHGRAGQGARRAPPRRERARQARRREQGALRADAPGARRRRQAVARQVRHRVLPALHARALQDAPRQVHAAAGQAVQGQVERAGGAPQTGPPAVEDQRAAGRRHHPHLGYAVAVAAAVAGGHARAARGGAARRAAPRRRRPAARARTAAAAAAAAQHPAALRLAVHWLRRAAAGKQGGAATAPAQVPAAHVRDGDQRVATIAVVRARANSTDCARKGQTGGGCAAPEAGQPRRAEQPAELGDGQEQLQGRRWHREDDCQDPRGGPRVAADGGERRRGREQGDREEGQEGARAQVADQDGGRMDVDKLSELALVRMPKARADDDKGEEGDEKRRQPVAVVGAALARGRVGGDLARHVLVEARGGLAQARGVVSGRHLGRRWRGTRAKKGGGGARR